MTAKGIVFRDYSKSHRSFRFEIVVKNSSNRPDYSICANYNYANKRNAQIGMKRAAKRLEISLT